MAWTRADWNDIIQRVNTLAQNPDSGCDPVSTLAEVGPDHIWTKTDIQQVRDKLVEICNENSFTAELRLWAQEVINEIEAAITNGWCGCNECSNAQGDVQTYLGTYIVENCLDCGPCDDPTCTDNCTTECRQAAVAAGSIANTKIGLWADAWSVYCTLQDQLNILETQLAALEAARDEACAHGTPEECAAAQAAVDAKQAEVDAKTQERDDKLIEANGYESEAEAKAAESLSLSDTCEPDGGVLFYYSSLAGSALWADYACNQLGPACLGRDPRRCRVWWHVQKKTTTHFYSGPVFEGFWTTVIGGGYTRQGSPYVTNLPGCGGLSAYACASCGPTACDDGCAAWYTHELRLIQDYPEPLGEVCCD
jgi:hypothetical protein